MTTTNFNFIIKYKWSRQNQSLNKANCKLSELDLPSSDTNLPPPPSPNLPPTGPARIAVKQKDDAK